MKLVRTAFGDHIGYRTAAASKFRRIRIGENDHFLNGIQVVGLEGLTLNGIVIVVLTVEQEVVRARTRSVYGESSAITQAVAAYIDDSGLRERQRNYIQIENGHMFGFHGLNRVFERAALSL